VAGAGSGCVAFAVDSRAGVRLERDLQHGVSAGRARAIVVALLVFGISLGVRLTGLDLYATTDEGYWMQRSVRFGAALARGDLTSTYRAGHPGVSVMWTGLLGIGPERLAPFRPERYTRYEVLEPDPGYLAAFGAARRAVAVVTSALVTVSVLLAWRLLGLGAGLFGGALLVFDPYVVGMTRLLHVDALLAPLMTVSALAGLIYWLQSPRGPYLLLSAVTGGLALLTKAPAGFLPIFFGLVWLAGRWHGGGLSPTRSVRPSIVWGLVAAAVYVLLFPALWVDPVGRLIGLLQFVLLVGLQPHDGNYFLGRPVLEDPGPLYYLVAVPLRLSPLVALGMGLLALRAPTGENGRAVGWLVLYVALFAALMTLASKKFDRYMLPAQMALDLLAGVGLWRLVQLLTSRAPSHTASSLRESGQSVDRAPGLFARWRMFVGGGILALVLVVQVALLVRGWPYPIAYYNPVAGGAALARQSIMVGWGEGLEQAAAYLNGLPDAESLIVATSYQHVVRPRFVGTTISIVPYVRGGAERLPTPDYLVLYVNARQRRQISPEVEQAEATGPPVFVAEIDGLPYAWVYRVPRTGPRPAGPLPAIEDSESGEN
jgi:hypothetical protein